MPPFQQTIHWAALCKGCVSTQDLSLVPHFYPRQNRALSGALPRHVLPLMGIRILSIIIRPTHIQKGRKTERLAWVCQEKTGVKVEKIKEKSDYDKNSRC